MSEVKNCISLSSRAYKIEGIKYALVPGFDIGDIIIFKMDNMRDNKIKIINITKDKIIDYFDDVEQYFDLSIFVF